MMPPELPDAIARYLEHLSQPEQAPLCMHLDAHYRVLESWGNAQGFGLVFDVGDDVRESAPYLDHLSQDGVVVLPFVGLEQDRAAHLHVMPSGEGWYVVFISATGELHRKREVQQSSNELRLQNERQTRLINELVEARSSQKILRDEAEEANRLKSRFIATLSHEIRTPLTAISGYARLIADAHPVTSDDAQRATSIQSSAEHILTLVDTVLEQSRLESGQPVIRAREVSIRELIRDITELIAPLAAEKALGFAAFVEPSLPALLVTDPTRLRQVMVNLLGNAVKFTDEGWVRLDVRWQSEELTVRVLDSGPGIAPELQASIFAAYQRGGREDVKGTGLGLSITHRIVQSMQGEITLLSSLGEGSEFVVRLPAPQGEGEAGAGAGAAGGAKSVEGARIVVAEDDEDIRVLIQSFLARVGVVTEFVNNASDAIRCATQHPTDLLIVDINLPGSMSGIEAAKVLRDEGFAAPIMVLSASGLDEDKQRAREAGCSDFLSKPFTPEDLIAAVRTLVRPGRAAAG